MKRRIPGTHGWRSHERVVPEGLPLLAVVFRQRMTKILLNVRQRRAARLQISELWQRRLVLSELEIASPELSLAREGEMLGLVAAFEPADDGYYRVTWDGDETELFAVHGETNVWVADPETRDLGFRPGGVQILVDRDTVRAGSTVPVMISAPQPDSWVLFGIEADHLIDYRMVHVEEFTVGVPE